MPSTVVDLQNRGSGRGVLPNPACWSRFVVPGKSTAKFFLSVVALLHQLTPAAALFSSRPGRSGSRSRPTSGGASSRDRAPGDAVHTNGTSVGESGGIFMAQQHAAPEDSAGSATDTVSSRNINQATQHGERGVTVQSGGQDEGAVARPVLEITHALSGSRITAIPFEQWSEWSVSELFALCIAKKCK